MKSMKTEKPKRKIERKPERISRPMIPLKAGKMIAITGSIASGKSFVLDCFENIGFEVFNYDRAIHKLLAKDGKGFAPVAKLFPEAVTDAGIDRKKLSSIVFQNPEKLKILEGILHPLARDAQVDFVINARKTSAKSMVFEVPLLFENNRQKSFDYVVVTHAPAEAIKERAMARDGMTEEKLAAILERQVKDAIRLKGAHAVIKTGGSKENTLKQVKSIVKELNVKRNSTGHRNNRPGSKKGRPNN